MPLYVRAGAVLPLGPLKQYTDEPVDGPLTLTVYPGANGSSFLYDDDGRSFQHRAGAFMRLVMDWSDAERRLDLHLAPGSRMVPAAALDIEVRLAGTKAVRRIRFDGEPVQVKL
jgi:alpha-glucosidase (family GH31 glycosyl hydrolase)